MQFGGVFARYCIAFTFLLRVRQNRGVLGARAAGTKLFFLPREAPKIAVSQGVFQEADAVISRHSH